MHHQLMENVVPWHLEHCKWDMPWVEKTQKGSIRCNSIQMRPSKAVADRFELHKWSQAQIGPDALRRSISDNFYSKDHSKKYIRCKKGGCSVFKYRIMKYFHETNDSYYTKWTTLTTASLATESCKNIYAILFPNKSSVISFLGLFNIQRIREWKT